MGQGSGISLCTSAWCAMYALQCMLIVYSHPIPMGQGSVMGHWALSSMLHALKIINWVFLLISCPEGSQSKTHRLRFTTLSIVYVHNFKILYGRSSRRDVFPFQQVQNQDVHTYINMYTPSPRPGVDDVPRRFQVRPTVDGW